LFPGLAFANLNNGVADAGLSAANANNALSNGNWNLGARHTAKESFI
jgi:hypothetical protein